MLLAVAGTEDPVELSRDVGAKHGPCFINREAMD